MDASFAEVLIAIIAGIFSIAAVIIQRKQDNITKKIDNQNIFIEKEKIIKDKMIKKEKESNAVIHRIMILILDTNLDIIRANMRDGESNPQIEEIFKQADELKKTFNNIEEEMDDIYKEYKLLLEMSSEIQKDMEERKKK